MQQQQQQQQQPYPLAGSALPEAEHLLSLLHDGDRCLAEARLSLRRSRKLLDMFRQEGTRVVGSIGIAVKRRRGERERAKMRRRGRN
jgi:hypothetical protein